MKLALWKKCLFLYGIFCLLSFLIIPATLKNASRYYVTEHMARLLYRDAYRISTDFCVQNYAKTRSFFSDTYDLLVSSSTHRGSVVFLLDTDGTILFDTSKDLDISAEVEVLRTFNPGELTGNYYQTGDFFGYFDRPVLSVVTPVISTYSVRGYVAVHYDLKALETEANEILNISYIALLLILLFSLILLLGFVFLIYRPLKRLNHAADEYATGNFNYTFEINTKDELDYLGISLQFLADQVNKAGEAQRRFVSNISHDLRSPLTSIKGYAEAILDGTIPPEKQDHYLNIVVTEADRLNKLTRSLLTLNTFDDKGSLIEMMVFDINDMIKTTLETFEGACREKNIRFSFTMDEPEQFVYADHDKIQQVFYNLIDNAIKFSFPNSTIYVETSLLHQKVFVSVKDTGIGIPQEGLVRIWDRFYKSDLSRGKDKKGTGLGLAISKEIIQAHGEHINVVSTENVGTEFTFTLQSFEDD